MAYTSWSVVFGEQPSASKWNILGTNDASFNDGTGIADGVILPEHLKNGSSTLNTWVWDSFTPTLSGRLDDGDWTKSCVYIRIGNLIYFTVNLISTAAAPMGGGSANAIFTLPVTAAAIPGTDARQAIGSGWLIDDNGQTWNATVAHGSTTTGIIYNWNTSANLAAITSTAPFTWTTSDEISIHGVYQAAA